jgi:hypothetical protein
MMARASLLVTVLGLALAAPAGAAADGLPVPGGVESQPLVTLDGKFRFETLPGRRGTNVARIATDGGAVQRSRFLPGRFVVPAVALDGTSSGLSAGGERLVLIRPRARYPQPETRLAILDGRTLRPQRIVTLDGDFSFDAISPDGRTLYLIQYLSGSDPTDYSVHAYDPRSRRLSEPIVDQREPDEDMSGFPVTRATSPDGRFAYTLYDNQDHPFVHALDTANETANCIDLPESLAGFLRRRAPEQVRLIVNPSGGTLTVVEAGRARATIDTRTLSVSVPQGAPAERADRPAEAGRDDGGAPWPLVVVAILALALAGGAVAILRKRRRLAPAPR